MGRCFGVRSARQQAMIMKSEKGASTEMHDEVLQVDAVVVSKVSTTIVARFFGFAGGGYLVKSFTFGITFKPALSGVSVDVVKNETSSSSRGSPSLLPVERHTGTQQRGVTTKPSFRHHKRRRIIIAATINWTTKRWYNR